jgi:thioredoxin 1
MAMTHQFESAEPARADIDASSGPLVLEFGTPWCGYCRAAQPLIAQAFEAHPAVAHRKVEDGPGRPLGRSFRIKLWPTLIFFKDGREVARLVRPNDASSIAQALAQVAGA